MGRKDRRVGGGGKRGKEDKWTDFRGTNVTWENIHERRDGQSPSKPFEEYYKAQRVCPEAEWDAFMDILQTPLPITFRINGSGKFSAELRRRFETDFFSKISADSLGANGGREFQPPEPMEWYPDRLAWHMNFSRAQLRKLPALEELHEFMKRENDAGAITRQEAVSMVPPFFLQVEPHHLVLDMCAAPGSKTFQLLETLHSGPAKATGLVVANDSDAKRCNLLAHQTKRMCSPCLLVTNHEGQLFPIVRPRGKAKQAAHGALYFDRILCDVPCSGDGTLRKAPDIWRRWTASNGNALHPLQLKITLQACRLLKVGGRLVYSTCTFNPIENEAVVAAVLLATKGALRLVDVSAEMPKLKRNPGLDTWQVMEPKSGKWFSTWEEAKELATERQLKLDPSMFPSAATADLPLQRTMRFLPHHQNTGGFFVAVFEKVAECTDLVEPDVSHRRQKRKAPEEGAAGDSKRQDTGSHDKKANGAAAPPTDAAPPSTSGATPAADEDTELDWVVRGGGGRGRGGNGGGRRGHRGIDPVVPVTDAALLQPVVDFYGLTDGFPLTTHLITRCVEALDRPRRCYYVSDATRRVLMLDETESLKVTATGLKLIERQEVKDGSNPCIYRLSQEGLPFLLPYITKQRLRLPLGEFKLLLEQRAVRIPRGVPCNTVRPPRADAGADAANGVAPADDAAADGTPQATPPAPDAAAQSAEGGAAPVASPTTDATGVAKGGGGGGGATGFAKTTDGSEPPLLKAESTLQQLEGVLAGCCVATLLEDDARRLHLPTDGAHTGGCLSSEAPLALSCWRTKSTVNILVSKPDAALILDKLQQVEREAAEAAAAGS